jgi:hypothetical protein
MATDLHQISDDLHFVRHVVEARARRVSGEARLIYLYWALYVLSGYFLIDVAPRYAGIFMAVGGLVGGFVSWGLGRYLARKVGEVSRADNRVAALHWAGGILLAVAGVFALATVIPALRGTAGSQVLLVMIGLVYYFWGVYVDRNFLWLGPVLMAGGVAVRFIPHYPWTCVGAVIAAGLVLPTFLPPARVRTQATAE